MLEDLAPPARVTPCAVRKLRSNLGATDQEILDKAIADYEAWPHKTLASALTQKGLLITEKPIRKHRLNECSCNRII
jgi:hypothetical protein